MMTRSLARRAMLAATILAAGSGCDKTSADRAADGAATAAELRAGTPGDTVDLGGRPPVLYQLFGERRAPRMLPVAVIADGRIEPIVLSDSGWREFDLLYHRPGAVYTVYRNGRATGSATVTQPMWGSDGTPLYQLPGCRVHTPLAAVRVEAPLPGGYLIEHLATDAPITERPSRGMPGAHLSEARQVAARLAEELGLQAEELEQLEFRNVAVATGARESPTLVISFIDPTPGATGAGDATRDSAHHLFILADVGPEGYSPTYTRVVRKGDSTEYRRYVDHLDLTGDGVDELILEGWTSGHESYLLVLSHLKGRWEEVFRGRQSWCVG